MQKICGIYKITNTVTGDFYIGSSKNVKRRWAAHKWSSTWNKCPNNPLYKDMQKYGLENFVFEIFAVVEPEELKETEQKFIETLKPTYNDINAKGLNVARRKEYKKTDKYKDYQKQYKKTDKCKEYHKQYENQLCFYNGQTITLSALRTRFWRQGLSNPTAEAKKYLLQ